MRCLLLVLILFTIQPPVSGQFRLGEIRKSESFGFKMVKNLVIIPVIINNKGPFNFVLDTGVGIFLITDPHLKDSLGLSEFRNITISGFGERADLKAYVSFPLSLKIGNHIKGYLPAAFLEEDAFNLSAYTGIPVHGLLGYEFFSSFVVKLNYSSRNIKVYKPETIYIPKRGSRFDISIEEGKPYIEAKVMIDSGSMQQVKLIIDSGAGHPISLETLAGQPFHVPDKKIEANLGVGLMGEISGFLARISLLRIGKFDLKNVLAAFPDYNNVAAKINSISRNGNLGSSVLKRFNVVFDYSREHIYLKPNYFYKEPFEHDMSGLELSARGENLDRIFIARVETGSAAEDAGLMESDEILAVNFKPVKEMGMDEVYGIFRSGRERPVLLNILPAGKSQAELVVLELKRRI